MKPVRLPAPAMPLLTPHDDYSLAHLIERHVAFYIEDENGEERNVALNPAFVRHYMKFRESKLPIVTSIATAPLVLPDGMLLKEDGLDRRRGILFWLQPELVALIPKAEECTPAAAAEAMRFLTDEWLCDVAADYPGKCILIAIVASILERALLPERPAFFVTAGQRGGGKTTTLQMLFIAATGYRVPAAAWSPNEEERRKALFSYLAEGVPAVVWDNIPRGTTISCPSIEKSLTAALYSDRVLGKTETRTVPATTICCFTGNNIAPRGDLASRSLQVRLSVDRPDPENREFKHPDPIAWTVAHRGNILRAIYTILLSNPRLREKEAAPAETRFKAWWHLIGSAVEHAAGKHKKCEKVSFKDKFRVGEADDEQSGNLGWLLGMLKDKWKDGFGSKDVADYASAQDDNATAFVKALEQASGKPILGTPSATVINWRLKAIIDAPVQSGDRIVALRWQPDESGHGARFEVEEVKP